MAKYSNFDTFIKAHLNKAMDYDGVAGCQCVDLIKYYLDEIFDIKPGAWGDAHAYYDNYNNLPLLKSNFTRISNTPDFIPQKGDIVVWKPELSSGGWGHIALASGEGDTTYFYSYDQNWTGNHDACTKIKHSYSYVYGVLRPKNQSKIIGETQQTNNTISNSTTENQKKIIDISQFQPDIDYKTLANEIDGGIIRVGYRGYGSSGSLVADTKLETHTKGFIDNKIPYGFYFFSQAVTVTEAVEEANYVYNKIKKYSPTHPIYIDVEYSTEQNQKGRADNLTKSQRTKNIIAFCERIEELGLIPGVYASESWFDTKIDFNSIKQYSIWVAKYGTDNGSSQIKPTISSYDGWQFTSKYSLNSISSKVDMSYFYTEFASIITPANEQTTSKSPTEYKIYYAADETGVNYRETPNGSLKGTYNWAAEIKIKIGSEIKKGNYTWVETDKGYWVAKELLSIVKPELPFKTNKNYILLVDLKVRTGPGITYAQKKRNHLTIDGKNNSYNQTAAVLKKGTIITALTVKKNGSDYWIQFPSGWLCARQGTSDYVKEK